MKTFHCAVAAAFAVLSAALCPATGQDLSGAAAEAGDVHEAAVAAAEAAVAEVRAAGDAVASAADSGETGAGAPDLSDAEAAQEYIDGYADNVQDDPDFKANIQAALATVREERPAYGTFWAVFPPILAIVLALITKEVYSSLFLGILAGGLIWSGFAFEGTVVHVFSDGYIASVADSYNVGILVFLVLLGALVAMMNKTGASAAFGRWASTHIRSRVGAQVCTVVLGMLIFIDDYFNCLTVGSVMKPVTDAKKVSRAKLA